MVVEVGHDRLVLRAVPLNVPGSAHPVSVHVLVVLVVDGSLAGAPLAVHVWDGWVRGEHTSECPVEDVWVVEESLGVPLVIHQHERTVEAETATDTSDQEESAPEVGEGGSHVEVLDGKLTDHSKAEDYSKLSSGRVVSVVEVRLVSWASDHGKITAREPALKHMNIMESLGSELKLLLLELVLTNTEAHQLAILHVVSHLGVDTSPDAVIVGVLSDQTNVSQSASQNIK